MARPCRARASPALKGTAEEKVTRGQRLLCCLLLFRLRTIRPLPVSPVPSTTPPPITTPFHTHARHIGHIPRHTWRPVRMQRSNDVGLPRKERILRSICMREAAACTRRKRSPMGPSRPPRPPRPSRARAPTLPPPCPHLAPQRKRGRVYGHTRLRMSSLGSVTLAYLCARQAQG